MTLRDDLIAALHATKNAGCAADWSQHDAMWHSGDADAILAKMPQSVEDAAVGAAIRRLMDAIAWNVEGGPDGRNVTAWNSQCGEGTGPTIRAAIAAALGEAEGCPVRSSITDAPCSLPEGHPQDSPTRFHRYAP